MTIIIIDVVSHKNLGEDVMQNFQITDAQSGY